MSFNFVSSQSDVLFFRIFFCSFEFYDRTPVRNRNHIEILLDKHLSHLFIPGKSHAQKYNVCCLLLLLLFAAYARWSSSARKPFLEAYQVAYLLAAWPGQMQESCIANQPASQLTLGLFQHVWPHGKQAGWFGSRSARKKTAYSTMCRVLFLFMAIKGLREYVWRKCKLIFNASERVNESKRPTAWYSYVEIIIMKIKV